MPWGTLYPAEVLEGSLGDNFWAQLEAAQLEYMTSVAPTAATLSKEQLKLLASSLQTFTNIAVKLIEENAYLRKRLDEQALLLARTYAGALQQKTKTWQVHKAKKKGQKHRKPGGTSQRRQHFLFSQKKSTRGRNWHR